MSFILADYIILGLTLLFAIIGLIVGFGKGLKFFTSGIFGFLISLYVTFVLINIVAGWDFVKVILERFTTWLSTTGTVGEVLNKLFIDKIVLGIVIFILVQIVRMIIVAILKGFFEINNPLFKFVNKLLGMLLFVGILVLVLFTVFYVVRWIGGNTEVQFKALLEGSVIKLDWLYNNNPMTKIFDKAIECVS